MVLTRPRARALKRSLIRLAISQASAAHRPRTATQR